MSFVHASQTRVTRPASFIKQQVMRLRPCAAVVKTYLDCVVSPAHLRVWIGEQQHMPHFFGFLVIDSQQAAVAVRLDQRVAIGLMRLPRLPQVFRDEHGAEPFVVVAHVEHDRAVAELGCLAFVAAAECGCADLPGRAMVAADHDGRERRQRVAAVAAFDRHHQRAVGQIDALLGRRGEQPPRLLFELAGQVLGLRPCEPVVL